ncbi:MAG: EscE/YscE/SsaE family type III secretion system needle protein co-chaperone [Planctomycetota bacterium]
MEVERIRMLDIEQKLEKDDEGSVRDEICEELNQVAFECKQEIDRGQTPEEFARLESIMQGFSSAVEVVERTWNLENSTYRK